MSDFLVSSMGLSGAPRMAVFRAQEQLAIAQKEVATGRYADVGLTLGVTVSRTISMRGQLSNTEKLIGANTAIAQRFDTMQAVLETVAQTGDTLKASIIANGASDVSMRVNRQGGESAIGQLIGALNTSFGSRSLFSGAAADQPAMLPSVSTDFATSSAKTAIDAAWSGLLAGRQPNQISGAELTNFIDSQFDTLFNDTNWKNDWSQASDGAIDNRIGDTETIQTSRSANEVAFRDLMKSYVMISALNPEELGDEARQVLTRRTLETLDKGLTELNSIRTEIGGYQERVKLANENLETRAKILEVSVAEIEEVDQYEASTRVTNLRNLLETSYAVTARISRMSILNYL
ncbi:MAG: flagellar hook-associated family protein [Fulvimarina manganoxydans]|uniref:flagellar hook-associated family protein n=1 Tax=Fulvimarina manganoxydans TaxID=937218 RepID=UPI002357CE2B|nr:flagellar hook-associated family protein [Fulvimarina manganoxydans]MCK5932802.1 flagellar hook-associated family protein [Fulvimarina manganoxydans]